MILCDTNIFINALNNHKDTIANMQRIGFDNIAISSITIMELYRGMSNKTELNQMRKYLRYYDVVHVSQIVSQNAVDLIRNFHLSHNLQIPDSIIGATAIAHNIPLFTYNTKDFRFMPDIVLYQDKNME